ncbi:MAG TPA: FkbM family methyltransferase [Candidatus Solibacter sp.]
MSPSVVSSPQDRLEQLLAESATHAAARESQAFDRAAAPFESRIVIYGAGRLGRRMLAGLRTNGLDALAFVDRNPAAWTTTIEGVPVLAPENAARRFGTDAVFVVAVWHPVVSGGVHAIVAQLTALGCRRVAPFVLLSWKYPREFLPNFLWDLPSRALADAPRVRQAFGLFHGARSQAEFLRQLEFRLTADFGCLQLPDGDPQYFPGRLFRPLPDEYFVDCGAYTGDTLLEFADWTQGRFRGALSLEADPGNFTALRNTIAGDDRLRGRVRAVCEAVGRERCTLRFAASGLASAALSPDGDLEVRCSPLDDLLADESPTYIKMDIEGAELDALDGTAAVLRRSRPALAICAYHLQDHLWRIPQRISHLMPEGRLLLRPHFADGFDLVCYAIPHGRSLDLSLEDAEG